MDVISLGFPEQTIPKWLNGYVYEWVQEGLLRCHMRMKFDEVEFHNWKEGDTYSKTTISTATSRKNSTHHRLFAIHSTKNYEVFLFVVVH